MLLTGGGDASGGIVGIIGHLKRLSAHVDPLEELGRIIDFEAFREKLTNAGALDAVFADFDRQLKERGYLAMGGQMGTSINRMI